MISIIIPVYNVEKYLSQCLESVVTQSFTNWECILVDDGSYDQSGTICDKYATMDSRFRVFHKENGGVSSARNKGLDEAEGKWICFADSDDYFYPNALEVLYQTVENEKCDTALASCDAMDCNGCIKPLFRKKNWNAVNDLKHYGHSALWGYIFSGAVIRKNRIRFNVDLKYSEDCIFVLSYALYSVGIGFSSEPVYVYRQNPNSACAVNDWRLRAEQQFKAASCLQKLSETVTDCKKKKYLEKRVRSIITMGVSKYSSEFPGYYRELESMYMKYFTDRLYLFFQTIKCVVTYYRRKVITFR